MHRLLLLVAMFSMPLGGASLVAAAEPALKPWLENP